MSTRSRYEDRFGMKAGELVEVIKDSTTPEEDLIAVVNYLDLEVWIRSVEQGVETTIMLSKKRARRLALAILRAAG